MDKTDPFIPQLWRCGGCGRKYIQDEPWTKPHPPTCGLCTMNSSTADPITLTHIGTYAPREDEQP